MDTARHRANDAVFFTNSDLADLPTSSGASRPGGSGKIALATVTSLTNTSTSIEPIDSPEVNRERAVFDGVNAGDRESQSPGSERSRATGKLRFRTIWISDTHLGTTGCQAGHLLDFLRHTDSRYLYLVGDIIDGWALKRRWYWHQQHNDIVQKILRKARKGTRVTFIAGNHDEGARQFLGLGFGGITIADEVIHTTAGGKRLLVIHGDQFDGVVQCAKWLAYVGDYLYELTLKLNRVFNWARRRIGLPYWSLSQYLKHKVKNAVSYISAFEEAVAREARSRGVDGVVCGHIHRAEIREIDGILYCNDGDWVESLSALVETHEGELRLITWHDIHALSGDGQKVPAEPSRMPAHA